MPSYVAVVCFRWRRTSMTSCEKLSYALAKSDFNAKITHFLRSQTIANDTKYYSYIIKGLLHWYRWILSLVGIAKDASSRPSISQLGKIFHRHQCNNHILYWDTLKTQHFTSVVFFIFFRQAWSTLSNFISAHNKLQLAIKKYLIRSLVLTLHWHQPFSRKHV